MTEHVVKTPRGHIVVNPPAARVLFDDTRFAVVWLIIRVLAGLTWLASGLRKLGDRILPLLRLAVERDIDSELLRPLLTIIDRAAEPCPLPIPGSTESLSPRETEVLRLIMAGASNRDIATELVIIERTVKAHVTHILSKLVPLCCFKIAPSY